MEERGTITMCSKRVEVITTVRLMLQKDLRLNIRGSVTGNWYHFNGGGSVLEVDERDAPAMLEKKPMSACCSGTIGSPYFLLVEGR